MAHKYDFYQARSWYQFCEIPNDEEGKFFIKQLRKYLNKGRYKVRVRGQYLNSKKHNWQEHTYGSTLATSTHMRVYISEKEAANSWESKNAYNLTDADVTTDMMSPSLSTLLIDDEGNPRYDIDE